MIGSTRSLPSGGALSRGPGRLALLADRLRARARAFGLGEAPIWYDSSCAVAGDFEGVGRKPRLFGLLRSPFPLYDWIMGFHERPSDRAALRGEPIGLARRILEVGVGTGYLLGLLVRRAPAGALVVAADRSRVMLRNAAEHLARRRLPASRVRFDVCDATRLPYGDASFDLYASTYLFDLLSDRESRLALREMERVLSPGGRAILLTMTTEVGGSASPVRVGFRCLNELYRLGYERGRWNPVWRFLFAGYAPHCRPIALGARLRDCASLEVESTCLSHVAGFPARIYRLRKRHG